MKVSVGLGVTTILVLVSAVGTAQPRSDLHPQRLPAILSIQGTLQYGEFFGPPNYGEAPKSDEREHHFYVQLPAPIGTQSPNFVFDPELEHADGYFIQLFVFDSQVVRMRQLIGRRVKVTGTLVPSQTAHDRTNGILRVSQVLAIERWRW